MVGEPSGGTKVSPGPPSFRGTKVGVPAVRRERPSQEPWAPGVGPVPPPLASFQIDVSNVEVLQNTLYKISPTA